MENNPGMDSFYFEVLFENEKSKFQSVSGFRQELIIEEGSDRENHYKRKIPKSVKYLNLSLQRAVLPANSKLIKWCKDFVQGESAYEIQFYNVSVKLLDASDTERKKWTFHNAYPVNYTVSDLKSHNNTVHVELIELAYDYLD